MIRYAEYDRATGKVIRISTVSSEDRLPEEDVSRGILRDIDHFDLTANEAVVENGTIKVIARTADTQVQYDMIRSKRNRLLDRWRWTIMPDSPLSAECQVEFKDWLKALQRVTIGLEPGGEASWPVRPRLRYASPEPASSQAEVKP